MHHVANLYHALGIIWALTTIKWTDRLRLWRKTINLYLAFLGFTDTSRDEKQSYWAMICAVLSSIYDYETDWVRVDNPDDSLSFQLLEKLLVGHPNQHEASIIARRLFQNDWGDCLTNDTLERGSESLRFYRLIINSRWLSEYSQDEIEQYGANLQLVDDALDWQEDKQSTVYNVFLDRDKQLDYIERLADFLASDFYSRLYQQSRIYLYLARTCTRNLRRLVDKP